jgi:hypothetical protein
VSIGHFARDNCATRFEAQRQNDALALLIEIGSCFLFLGLSRFGGDLDAGSNGCANNCRATRAAISSIGGMGDSLYDDRPLAERVDSPAKVLDCPSTGVSPLQRAGTTPPLNVVNHTCEKRIAASLI